MADTPVLVTPTRLRDFIVDALAALKMPRPAAEIIADLMGTGSPRVPRAPGPGATLAADAGAHRQLREIARPR